MRANNVKLAFITMPRSSLSSSCTGRSFLPKKAPSWTDSHKATREMAKTKRGKSAILIKVTSATHFPESIGDTHSNHHERALRECGAATPVLDSCFETNLWLVCGRIPRFVLLQVPDLAFAKSPRAYSDLGSGNPFVLEDSNHDTAVFRL